MAGTDRAIRAGVAFLVAALTSLPAAAETDIEAKTRQMQAASNDAARLMAQITDAASASRVSAQLEQVMRRYHAAQDVLQAAVQKTDAKDPKSAKTKETVQAELLKADKKVGGEQKRLLADKDTARIVAKHFERKKKKDMKETQDKSADK